MNHKKYKERRNTYETIHKRKNSNEDVQAP